MSRTRNVAPSYIPHTKSGRGRLQWYDATGTRREKLLPGPFNSPESLAAKARLELELVTSPTATAAPVDPAALSVAEVLAAYLDFAHRHYRGPDGNPSDEVRHVKTVIRHVRELYGTAPAAAFGPMALKTVRQKFVELKWTRKSINARVERVRRIFKWAVAEELVSPLVYQSLSAVAGLQRGRTAARETAPIPPVDPVTVDATLPFLNRHVAGLVEFQRLTGCRPGEACAVRRRDLDTGGAVWLYKPASHKTAWKGKARVIYIGAKAQSLLRGFFTPDMSDYLFSPARAGEEFRADRAAGRKTPKYPSHMKRNVAKQVKNPKRRPADRYPRLSYLTALTRGCDRAFPPVGERARRSGESVATWRTRLTTEERTRVKTWQREHHWHPNPLRHSYATKVRREHGLEAAQVLLGHSRADVMQVYAERTEALAATVAAKIGKGHATRSSLPVVAFGLGQHPYDDTFKRAIGR